MKSIKLLLMAFAIGLGTQAQPASACNVVLQAPATVDLQYDPFAPTNAFAAIMLEVRNTSATACDVTLSLSVDAGNLRMGNAIGFELSMPDGGTINIIDPGLQPMMKIPLAAHEHRKVSPRILLKPGQVTASGRYAAAVEFVLSDVRERVITRAVTRVQAAVPSTAKLAIAGAGIVTTIDFQTLQPDKQRSIVVNVQSNQAYLISFSSKMKGRLILDPPIAGEEWHIPYALTCDGAEINLQKSFELHGGDVDARGFASHLIELRIGQFSNARAGKYNDELTLHIQPKL